MSSPLFETQVKASSRPVADPSLVGDLRQLGAAARGLRWKRGHGAKRQFGRIGTATAGRSLSQASWGIFRETAQN